MMDVEIAANILGGTILTGLSIVIVIIFIVIINNIIHKYWRPIKIFTDDSWNTFPNSRFVEPHEVVENKETKDK
jgi:hypothetical protein